MKVGMYNVRNYIGYIYICMYVCVCMYIYIYIYKIFCGVRAEAEERVSIQNIR